MRPLIAPCIYLRNEPEIGILEPAAGQKVPSKRNDLERFRVMLAEKNEVMNLVGPASLPDFWNRHAWDSAQLLDLAPEAKT